MLLESLPDHGDDVRRRHAFARRPGAAERSSSAASSSAISPRRFKLGRAVLVASPNEGTPLATPQRWDDTVGWIANVLEMFPDNPFTTGAAFVANGLVWLANHASGDLPGLHAMDGDGEPIEALQGPPGPPPTPIPRSSPTTIRPAHLCSGCWMSASISSSVRQRSGRAVRRRLAHRSLEPRLHPGDAHRLFRSRRQPARRRRHARQLLLAPKATADFLVNALLGRPQPSGRRSIRARACPTAGCMRGMTDAPSPRAGDRASGDAAARTPTHHGADQPLRITVVNGDLTFEREAAAARPLPRDCG